MSKAPLLAAAALGLALGFAASPAAAQPRSHVLATGSSTVAPFTQEVAATLRERGGPLVEVRVVGTVGGFAEFCQGVGLRYADVANASRRMNRQEFAFCASRGVGEVIELPIGYDGIVLAHRRDLPTADFRLEHIWRGLAREVPVDGRWLPNPYTRWDQVSPLLPAWPIRVIGPPGTSGTRDSFHDLALMPGCMAVPEIRAIADAGERRRRCLGLRTDGGFIEAGEDDEAIVNDVVAGPAGTLGLFGFSFLDRNRTRIEGARVEGVDDTRETIANGTYPLSRPLFIYVKRAHLDRVPALEAFLAEYLSDAAMRPDGYLSRRGLVTLDATRLEQTRELMRTRTPMRLPALN
jgi:phosphate transport system substrate-binding protein